ncbi:hypothetical protein MKW92_009648 [Papaver armeniacum]|nr:hypothetical protein MKW92_009648 [Papaver armeniacum]
MRFSPTKKKRGNEIGDIFSSKKKNREEYKVEKQDKRSVQGKNVANEIDEIFALRRRGRKSPRRWKRQKIKRLELKKPAKKMKRNRVSGRCHVCRSTIST